MSLLYQLKHVYGWYKYQYYFSIGLSVFAALWHWINPLDLILLNGALILVALLSCFTVFKADHASWKYVQSLPLSRKELYHFKLFDTALSFLPLFVWAMIFHRLVWMILFDEEAGFTAFIKLLMLSVLAVSLVSILSFQNLYDGSRSPYNRGNQKKILYQRYRDFCYYFTSIIYGVSIAGILVFLLREYIPLVDVFKAYLKPFWNIWTLIVFCTLVSYFTYKSVFHKWMDEKLSYVKLTWEPRKDIPRMAVCLVLIISPILYMSTRTPSQYGDSNLVDAVHSGKIDKVKEVLARSNEDINKPSNTGFTALMVAADKGDLKMYRFLLEKGASRNGKVHSGDKFYIGKNSFELALQGGNVHIVRDLFNEEFLKNVSGDYPLHVAAGKCHIETIDFLLEKGADPEFISKKGKTSLHYATERGCMNGVISLIEAGADTLKKDKTGKSPVDYLSGKNSDLSYYLTKKNRSPAGK